MATIKTERIEIDLPEDIIFAMRGVEKQEEVKKKGHCWGAGLVL